MNIYDLIEAARATLDRFNFIKFLAELYQAHNEKQQNDMAKKWRVIK